MTDEKPKVHDQDDFVPITVLMREIGDAEGLPIPSEPKRSRPLRCVKGPMPRLCTTDHEGGLG